MTYSRHLLTLVCAPCVLLFGAPVQAAIISFGSGGDQFNMEFVEIGDPGNAADATGNPANPPYPTGAVPYVYNMGKFEVSEDMITKANNLGSLGITKDTRGVDKPATSVSWNEAARFVNWLNTSEGFSPAYKFATQPGDGGYSANANIELWTIADTLDYDASNPFRSRRANYVLPSVDEWYKAAYYDPVSDTYGDFPTSDGTVPTAVTNGTTDKTAVFDQSFVQGPADITDAGGLSPFGIMALGGNVFEWEETELDLVNDSVSSARGVRGGDWGSNSSLLSSSDRINDIPVVEPLNVGFRVASQFSEDDEDNATPEPGTFVLGLGLLSLLLCRRIRKTSL